MPTETQSTIPDAPSIVPVDRLYRLSVDQYHRMTEAGVLPEDGRVELRDGRLCLKHSPSSEPSESYYPLSVDQYHVLARLGILTTNDRVELLEGWLVTKMTKYTPHVIASNLIYKALARAVPPGWDLSKEDPIVTLESEPEPDIMVFRGSHRDYRAGHPGPRDVAFVVEVADSSLRDDRRLKKRLYARASIPIYWIVNLVDGWIEVYTEPSGPVESPDYRQRQDYGPADAIPVVIEGREVGRLLVADLLP